MEKVSRTKRLGNKRYAHGRRSETVSVCLNRWEHRGKAISTAKTEAALFIYWGDREHWLGCH